MGDFKGFRISSRGAAKWYYPAAIQLLVIVGLAWPSAALAQKPLSSFLIEKIKIVAAKKTAGDYDRDGPCRAHQYHADPLNPRGGRSDCELESYWCAPKGVLQYSADEYADPDGPFQRCAIRLWQYAREGRWNAIALLRLESRGLATRETPSNQRTRPKSASQASLNRSTGVSPPGQTAPVLDHGDYMDIDELGNTEVLDVTSPPPPRRTQQRSARLFCLCKGGDIESLGVCNDPNVRGAYNTGYYPWTPQCKNSVSR